MQYLYLRHRLLPERSDLEGLIYRLGQGATNDLGKQTRDKSVDPGLHVMKKLDDPLFGSPEKDGKASQNGCCKCDSVSPAAAIVLSRSTNRPRH